MGSVDAHTIAHDAETMLKQEKVCWELNAHSSQQTFLCSGSPEKKFYDKVIASAAALRPDASVMLRRNTLGNGQA